VNSIRLLAAWALLCANFYPSGSGAELSPPDTAARREMLVKWQDGPGSDAAARGNRTIGAEVQRNFVHVGWQQVALPPGMTLREGIEAYRALGTVLAVEAIDASTQRPRLPVPPLPGGPAPGLPISQATSDAEEALAGLAGPAEPAEEGAETGQRLRTASPPNAAVPTLIPNDPQFGSQWNLKKISAPQAWLVSTGSTEVVVAVIDTGIDYLHEDLAPNMWRNPGETGLDAQGRDKATNGIDDDGDGYVDDVYGVDVTRHTGNPRDQIAHGTGLAGIIGAVGNNKKGVAGINWGVKMMAVAMRNATVAEFIEAADYVIGMKKRGVNIRVISNSYFNDGRYPLADVVNAAGAEDILTVFDADNTSYNDDVFFFDSPYTQWTITVAGSTSSDGIVSYSGYGRSTIDLAAPTEVPTTLPGSYTGSFGGTSAAQPHVAAAAALLAAVKPDATALELKAALKRGVDHIPGLTNKLVTGGRLNLAKSMQALTNVNLPPIVLGALPVSDQTRLDDPIEILFSQPMDRASVEAAFQITPAVHGTLVWTNGDRTLQFVHSEPFRKELFTTNYTCRIAATAHDLAGRTLDGNFNQTSEASPADDFVWTFSLHLANDDFADALPISGSSGMLSGTTRYATPENAEPLFSSGRFWGLSVWYRWTAEASGWTTFDLTVSNKFDTVLGVFTGATLETLTTNIFNDNYGPARGSRVSFSAVQGATYYLKVAGKYPGTTVDTMWGDFTLIWYPTPAPGFTGDEFSPVSAPPGTMISITGTNLTGATAVSFNGVNAATFTNAVNNILDLQMTAVVPTNATSGPITIATPHGTVTSTTAFQVEPPLILTARTRPDGKIELAWPATARALALEVTDLLGPGESWRSVSATPVPQGNAQTVVLVPELGTRYFRLHGQ
jgi:subtilisin family serine protease